VPARKDTQATKVVATPSKLANSLTSPLPTSRAGRKNSPRIDYKTGQRLDLSAEEGSPAANLSPVGRKPLRTIESIPSGRKRNNDQISGAKRRSSNSPLLKKKPAEAENVARDSLEARRSKRSSARVSGTGTSSNITDEEIIDGTPPNKPSR
jgi:hypothetical protein